MASASDLFLLGIGYRMVRGGEDQFAKAGEKIKRSAKEATKEVSALEEASDAMADKFAGLTSPAGAVQLALAGIATAATIAGLAIHKALEEFGAFEQGMKNVKAVSGSTEAQLAGLSDAALDLAQNSRFKPKELTDGLYALASAGFDSNQQLSALPGNMNYAEAAQTSLGQATETTLLAINNFNLAAGDTNRVADVFTAAIGKSAFNADRLSVALRNAAPAAGTMNQSFEGTMAVLSVLVKRFNNGELAGTGFKVSLAQLQAKAKDLGIQVRDAHGEMLPFADILDVLEKRGIHAKDAVALFGQEAGPALAVLMSTGSKALREMEAGLASNGQAAKTAKDQLDTLEGSQARLANSISVFWIRLGRSLSGGQRDLNEELIRIVQRATDWVVEHADEIAEAWSNLTDIAGAALSVLAGGVALLAASGEVFTTLKEILYGVAAAWAVIKLQTILATVSANTYALTTGLWGAVEAALLGIEAAWVAITGATLDATAAMLLNPIGLIAIAVAALVFAVQRYIDKVEEAWELERRRMEIAEKNLDYLNKLRTRTDVLTEAEAAHGKQMLANLEIERARAQVEAQTAQRELSERQRMADLTKGDPYGLYPAVDENAVDVREMRDKIAYAKSLETMQASMEQRLRALGGLSDETINVVASAADGAGKAFEELDKSLQKALASAKLAAERAEALYQAHQEGLPKVLAVTLSFEQQDAALIAVEAGNLSAAAALAEYARRTFEANRNTALLVAGQERLSVTGQKLAEVAAAVADAVAGNGLASAAAARAEEVEGFRQKFLLGLADPRLKALKTELELRDREMRYWALKLTATQRDLANAVAVRTAEAELADAKNRTTEASRNLAVQLEIEARLREEPDGEADRIAAEIISRHAAADAKADEMKATLELADANRSLRESQARLADQLQFRSAVRTMGEDLAGILDKYGLLSDATKKLALEERARQIFQESAGTRTLDSITAELQAQQAAADAVSRTAAGIEIAQSKVERFYSSFAGALNLISDAFGGSSTQLGRLAGDMAGVVTAIGKLSTAGKAFSVDWTNAMIGAVASLGALLKDLNVGASNKTGGTSALGGKLDSNYAGIGAIAGTIIGAALAAIFSWGIGTAGGASLGGAIGTVVGAMITKAGDSASAHLVMGGEVIVGEVSHQLGGAIEDALKSIFRGLNQQMAALGLTLQGIPLIDIKVRDNIVRVVVGAVTRTFATMADAVSFGITEALKQAAALGSKHLPPEVLAALRNTSAKNLEELQSDIAFAQAIANYGVPLVVQAIDKAISEYMVAMQRATELGIDTAKVNQQFIDTMAKQKDDLLGISRAKSPADQLKADVAAFNQRSNLLRAEQLASQAEMTIKRAELVMRLEYTKAEAASTTALAKIHIEGLMALQASIAAIDAALIASQGIIDGLVTISDQELRDALARLGRGAGGGRAQARKDFEEELQGIVRGGFPAAVVAVLELGDKLRDLAARAKELKYNEDLLRQARQALIDQTKKSILDPVRQYLTPAEGGTFGMSDWQKQRAEIEKTFADARAANNQLIKDTGQRAIADWRLVEAQKRAMAELAEAAVTSLGLPVEQTKAKVKGLRDTMLFLKDSVLKGAMSVERFDEVMQQLAQQASLEVLGSMADLLEQAGRFDEADKLRRAMDELNFHIQLAQIEILYRQYVALGLISSELQAQLDPLLAWIKDPANWPDFTKPAPQRDAGGAAGDAGQSISRPAGPLDALPTGDDAARRKAIMDQIATWNQLGQSDVTSGLRQLHDTLVEMQPDALRLGISLADLMAANAHAVEDFWDQTLAPYEQSDNVIDRLAEINRNFDEMIAAAQQYGGDQSRIEAARLAEVERFWDEALQPIRDLREQFNQGAMGGLSPEQRLAAAQARFNDLAARAVNGDASAIAALPDAVQALLDQQRAFSGTGPAYQALVATIQSVLDQILSLGGAGAAGVAGQASAPLTAGLPSPGIVALPGTATPAPRPVLVPRAGQGQGYAPLPVPDQRPSGAGEADAQARRDDRRANAELRVEVDRLVAANREQGERIEDLLSACKRLVSLVESQERRAAQR